MADAHISLLQTVEALEKDGEAYEGAWYSPRPALVLWLHPVPPVVTLPERLHRQWRPTVGLPLYPGESVFLGAISPAVYLCLHDEEHSAAYRDVSRIYALD